MNRLALFFAGVMSAVIVVWTLAQSGPVLTPVHADSTPCDSITGDPNPPIGSPEPDIMGHILASNSVGISGATVRLYVCDGSTPSLVASTTTTSGGVYGFPDLDGPAWYFVQAVITGPLAGKTPSEGTSNPTDLIDVGTGATGVDLTFE